MTGVSDAPDAAERAYHAVSAMILAGEVAEGDWLRESALAEQIGVSRTPVREALNRLSAEGVVEMHPRRGAQVVSLSEEELAALFDLRVRFEPLAAGLAVPRLGEEELHLLCDLADRMERIERSASPDWQEMSRLNNEFHSVFSRHAGNRHLTTAIQAVTRPVVVARTFRTYSKAALARSMRHHRELIDAVRARDGEWAEAVMRAHILAARHAQHDAPEPEEEPQ